MRVPAIIFATALTAASAARATDPPPGEAGGEREAPRSLRPAASPADARSAQVMAAQANAMTALRESVRHLEVGRGLHVGDVVDRTGSADELTRALSVAKPLGGPRWVDDQTCQVQVAVPGAAVADAVSAMAARYPGGRLPIRPEALNNRLSMWRATAFSAAGSSVAGGSAVQQVRPMQAGGRWAEVPDAVRRRAVADAQADAVRRAADDLAKAVGPVLLGDANHRAVDALARPFVTGQVRTYLDGQPVTRVEFLDDLTVSLTMTVDPRGLAQIVHTAVTADQPRLSAAADGSGAWASVRSAIEQGMSTVVVGTASAGVAPGSGNLPAVVLPMQPPDWVDGELRADGQAVAPAGQRTGRLKVKGMAEAAAIARLRDQLLALHVTPTATLGDAARADPQLDAAVSRVLLNAHDYHVEFLADGSVRVSVHINLRDAWDQLRSNP